jgi:multidrug efflux system outer membrane protein
MITFIKSALGAATLAALAACSVEPAYHRPKTDVPAAFKEAYLSPAQARQWMVAHPAEASGRGEWWTVFNDPELDRLERQALSANQNLRIAAARVKESRAQLGEARSALYPQLDAGFGPTRERASNASQRLSADAPNPPLTLWRAQASVSYEADLFGRVSASTHAAAADTQQSEALFQSVRLALQADVAQAYFHLRRLDADAALYRQTLALRSAALDLTQRQYAAGDISDLNVARASTELASARSEALGIDRQRAAAEHALAILLGKPPADFTFAPHPLERTTVTVPAGVPSSLLQRRPDIAAAERAMAAANARIGLARSAFFPRLDVTGAFGYESSELGDLLKWSSRTFLLGPLVGTALSLPIFDGGRRQAQLDRARATYEEDVAAYRQTVLVAFREVDDSLADMRILGGQMQAQDKAVESAAHAAKMLHTQYREGSISYLDVIDGDRVLLQQRRASVALDEQRVDATVSLIRALGGGWGPVPAAHGSAVSAESTPAALSTAAPGTRRTPDASASTS